jgi:UDP-N-acetylglucosamine 4,6-dehydratase
MLVSNKRILVTGGAGFLGKACISRWYNDNDIIVYSRDEAKHYFLKKKYPKIKTIVGDIRDISSLEKAAKGCNLGVFAASLKQIEACDENPIEAVKTILLGAINSRQAAENAGMEAATFISSDKSRSATTLYGSLKFSAGECFILNSSNTPRLTTAIYGNVLNSTGSIIPLIWEKIKSNSELVLYSPEMTRFIITVDEAVDLIESSFEYSGVATIPKITSCSILDLFQIYAEKFGLRFSIGSPRIGEKLHEIMASSEEARRIQDLKEKNLYILHPKTIYDEVKFNSGEYSSKDNVIERKQLETMLEKYNYFTQ